MPETWIKQKKEPKYLDPPVEKQFRPPGDEAEDILVFRQDYNLATVQLREALLAVKWEPIRETITAFWGGYERFPEQIEPKLSASALKTRLRATNRSAEERIEALYELVLREVADLSETVVSLLEREDIPPRLLEALVAASEELDFGKKKLRPRLAQALKNLSHRLKDDESASTLGVLWTAIRRYASVVEDSRIDDLAAFMTAKEYPATRQAALQAVQNVFWSAPPRDGVPLEDLIQGIDDLATTYLNPFLLSSPEDASLAMNAICAAAVIGHEKLSRYVHMVCELGDQSFARQVGSALKNIADTWDTEQPALSRELSAIDRLEEALRTLTDSATDKSNDS